MRLFEDDCHWIQIRDGGEVAFRLFKRHYTYRSWRQRNRKNGKRIAGPGERIILISKCGKALFIWRKEKYRLDDQQGVNCAVFRNESNILSSILIEQAVEIAKVRWPLERLYTFVNAKKIKSVNPGYCFKKAGFILSGITKARKLIILEKI